MEQVYKRASREVDTLTERVIKWSCNSPVLYSVWRGSVLGPVVKAAAVGQVPTSWIRMPALTEARRVQHSGVEAFGGKRSVLLKGEVAR